MRLLHSTPDVEDLLNLYSSLFNNDRRYISQYRSWSKTISSDLREDVDFLNKSFEIHRFETYDKSVSSNVPIKTLF